MSFILRASIVFSSHEHPELEAVLTNLSRPDFVGAKGCQDNRLRWSPEEGILYLGNDKSNASVTRDIKALFKEFNPTILLSIAMCPCTTEVPETNVEVGQVWEISFANMPEMKATVTFI